MPYRAALGAEAIERQALYMKEVEVMYVCEICGKEFDNFSKYGGHKSGHSRLGKKRKDEYGKRIRPVVYGSICMNCGGEVRTGNKYCSKSCQNEYEQKEWEKKWLSGEISGYSEKDHWGNVPDRIRKYLFHKFDSRCSVCGWGEVNPYTGRVPLEVEHIDGDYKNNRPENVTLLCPNCHSLTKSYRGANRGNGRKRTWKPINID